MSPCQWDKEVPVLSRILLSLTLQLKKAQMFPYTSCLWRRCGEFSEMILAYILTKSNWLKNWSRHQWRRIFVIWATTWKWFGFYRKIIFSDQAHIWLNGFLNKENMHYWSDSNPHILHESSLHPENITVWCGLWTGGVPHISVNGNRYRSMITEYFWP